jgi:Ca-activated chloride channel family protein
MDKLYFEIDWEAFHFLRPHFLWLLAPLVIVLILGLIGIREQVTWKKYIAPHLRPYMIRKGNEWIRGYMQVLAFLVLSIAVLGMAGPTWKTIELPEKILETPLIIAIDLSQSMMATDLQPNRLERAKFKINDLLQANPKARIALIGYAGTAHTLVPLTRDYKILDAHLKSINTRMLPFPGSDLSSALSLSDSLVAATEASGTLLLITDDFNEENFQLLQEYTANGNMKVEVIPMGTLVGAEVPQLGSKRPMRDTKGNSIVSVIDAEQVKRLNTLDKVSVIKLTLDNSDMERLATLVRKDLEFSKQDENMEENWQDEGIWLIIPFAFFILMWFRKGWVIYSFATIFLLGSCRYENSFSDLWTTPDYRGQKLYEQGEYAGAAKLFTTPIRKGLSYYKSGDYYKAIDAFGSDSTAQGQYNLGLAYFKIGEFDLAQSAFENSVAKDPDMKAAAINLTKTQQLVANAMESFEAPEKAPEDESAKNIQNTDPEDLGGGGQEATDEDMEEERKEETVDTETRMGKELDEVPDDFSSEKVDNSQKILMRKVDDDPSLFLRKKFAHQVRVKNIKPKDNLTKW